MLFTASSRPLIVAAAAGLLPGATALCASVDFGSATAGAAADSGVLVAELAALDLDSGYASIYLANDENLGLPGDGGVGVQAVNPGWAISHIDARTAADNRLDVSGTSRSSQGDTAHQIRFGVSSAESTELLIWTHSQQASTSFDEALLNSLKLYDSNGDAVAFDGSLTTGDNGLPAVRVVLGAGTYTGVLSADAAAAIGDDHFALSVAAVPAPSAVAAGLLGLGALIARRRRVTA